MTKPEWTEIVAMASGLWPHSPIKPETIEAYFLLLQRLASEDVRAALIRIAGDEAARFLPTVGQIIAKVSEAKIQPEDPETILGDILRAVRRHGYMANPNEIGLSPLARATVHTIGWVAICDSTNPEALRAHILRVASRLRLRAIELESYEALGVERAVPCPILEQQRDEQKARQRFLDQAMEHLAEGR